MSDLSVSGSSLTTSPSLVLALCITDKHKRMMHRRMTHGRGNWQNLCSHANRRGGTNEANTWRTCSFGCVCGGDAGVRGGAGVMRGCAAHNVIWPLLVYRAPQTSNPKRTGKRISIVLSASQDKRREALDKRFQRRPMWHCKLYASIF